MIKSSKEVTIGKNGHLKGSIISERLIIQGFLEGTVDAKSVTIKSQGHVHGDITSSELVIESKGVFEGNSIAKDVKPALTKS